MTRFQIRYTTESVDNIQRAYVQALSVDRQALRDAQRKVDAERGDQILKNAFADTPANAVVQTVRLEKGCPLDPIKEYRARCKKSASQSV